MIIKAGIIFKPLRLEFLMSAINIEITKILSAIGSSIFPNSLTSLFFLAYQPSKKSVIPAKQKRIKLSKYENLLGKIIIKDVIIIERRILVNVKKFGIFPTYNLFVKPMKDLIGHI